MTDKTPLVYYAENPTYIDHGIMTIYRFGGTPNIERYYEVKVENQYGYGSLRLTEEDIRRLFSCLSSEVLSSKNLPKLQPRISPDLLEDYYDDEEDYEMQGGDNAF